MEYKRYNNKKSLGLMAKILLVCLSLPLIFIFGTLCYCDFFLDYYPISGNSMQPLLNPTGKDDDHVFLKETKNISYGDVIIYKKTNGELVIKRVIALPGDNITVMESDRTVEDRVEYSIFIQYGGEGEFTELGEKYIEYKQTNERLYIDFYSVSANKTFLHDGAISYLHLESDELFYLGDNRLNSNDCADYGPQKTSGIVGKVMYIIHPNQSMLLQVIQQILGLTRWQV